MKVKEFKTITDELDLYFIVHGSIEDEYISYSVDGACEIYSKERGERFLLLYTELSKSDIEQKKLSEPSINDRTLRISDFKHFSDDLEVFFKISGTVTDSISISVDNAHTVERKEKTVILLSSSFNKGKKIDN